MIETIPKDRQHKTVHNIAQIKLFSGGGPWGWLKEGSINLFCWFVKTYKYKSLFLKTNVFSGVMQKSNGISVSSKNISGSGSKKESPTNMVERLHFFKNRS